MEEVGDLFAWQQTTIGGATPSSSSAAHPCGTIAKYYFSDTVEIYETGDATFPASNEISLDQSDIAHSYDDSKFKNLDGDWENKQWLDLESGPVRVWYQMETDFDFKKLHGKLGSDLNAGTKYSLII